MGKSVFICRVDSTDAIKAAIKGVLQHNASAMVSLGHDYTDEEFARRDPLRHKSMLAIKATLSKQNATLPSILFGCQQAMTRGENIDMARACIVKYKRAFWLEVTNGGGGMCTTKWLQENSSECGWIGTEGKPIGWLDAPVVKHDSLLGLLKDHSWLTPS